MQRSSKFFIRISRTAALAGAIVLLASVMLVDDNGTAPPQGIVPTKTTLAQLRAAHQRAIGHASTEAPFLEHWSIDRDGESGTETVAERGDDFRVDDTLGTVHTAYGSLHGTLWHQSHNGDVITDAGIHKRTGVDDRLVASLTGPYVRLLGEVKTPAPSYVVRIDPPQGRLEYVFYDKSSGLVTRIEEARRGTRYIVSYGDFRTTDGITQAWRVHSVAARTQSQRTDTLDSIDRSGVTDADLALPANSSAVHVTSYPQTLPAKILSDRVIVTVKIKGRPVNLQLDSGAGTILVDSSVIQALNIPTVGKRTATMAGTYDVADARVPQIDIGDGVSLDDVVVNAAPFQEWADDHTVVAGLLGFDFINSVVLHIDYAHGTVQVLDPKTFAPPAGASGVPIALDDNVPVVAATIGTSIGKHFIVDTGADRSSIYSGFAKAHPKDVVDQGLGTEMRDASPFETSFYGVGGKVSFRSTQVGPFTFAAHTFPTWLFEETYNAASFEDEDYDGLIGQDVLRYFDVYLDYPQKMIYVVPNSRYVERFE